MKISRREFVKATMTSGAALAGGVVVVGCGNAVEPAPLAQPTRVSDTGHVAVVLAVYPDIQRVGGALTVPLLKPSNPVPGLRTDTLPSAILLFHRPKDSGPEFVATTSACPHEQCPLGYNQHDDLIECPCHASRFRAVPDPTVMSSCTGQRIHLPAKADLSVWPVDFDGSTISVNLGAAGGCNVLPATAGGVLTLKLADFPSLSAAGGFIVGTPANFGPLILIRLDATTILCLDATCTHQGCPVSYSARNSELECPCHGSTFDLNGAVKTAPAKLPLVKYPTTFDATTITVRGLM